jgi:transcriptional regulator with XRE-family HTH domain
MERWQDSHVQETPSTPSGALDDPAGVGPRITALRREKGLSLSELARRAGVGKATLSGLEAGTRNSTLDTLYAIASALAVPISAVVADPAARGQFIHGTAVRVEMVRSWADTDATYELFRLWLPAGGTQESAPHHAGVTECAVVFAGELVAGPVDAPVRVAAGGFAEWPADVRHGYAAVGPDDVHATLLIRSPAVPRHGAERLGTR